MMYMLDMDICIYAIKHKPEQVFQHMQENLQKGLCISAITRFLAVMEILPFDGAAANAYRKICAYLQRQGTPIGTMDMLIAGHALTANRILVTNHVKEFERVPGLRIENWGG